MELKEAIYNRRSVRSYSDEPVEKHLILTLLDAAIQAPSAMNNQPWSFVVIQDKSLLRAYSDRAKVLCRDAMTPASGLSALKGMLSDPEFNIFYNSSTLIVICAKPLGQHPEWDCYLAGQNLMLTAHSLGLGTCPIGLAWSLFGQEDVRTELQIPTEYTAVLPIIVGHSKETASAVTRSAPNVLCWVPPKA